jgi:AmmeMemoRadiSam system protein A/AmmeMemoRadiSam system protein B
MGHASSLVFAGIAPHPPIMVPEVGRDAIAEVRASIDGMATLTQRLIAAGTQTVVMISPHAPLEPSAFVAYDGPQLYANFANFRAPAATVAAELDESLLIEITRAAADEGLIVLPIKGCDLDHGTAVPLYFLQHNGWNGKVVAFGYSFLSNEDHLRFGKCIRRAIEKVERPVAFVASGDLSHRLTRDAPAGYNPQAHLFDEEVVEAIYRSATHRIVEMDPEQRRVAGECGYRSMLVAIGVAEGGAQSCEVISYEAPFGVGYLVAQLAAGEGQTDKRTETPESALDALPALARLTIETFIATGAIIKPPENPMPDLTVRAACFVSIKTRDGELRGCIGTIEPEKETLAEELITNAISAATRDPRFPPVRTDELPNLKYSVDVLSAPEPCQLEDLDPKTFGVIVEDEDELRRGLLLPDLQGIESATMQVEIAARKAGIRPGEPVRLYRFRVERYSESGS